MTSLDCARYELAMHGREMMQQALALASYAREQINRIAGFACMGTEVVGQAGIAGLDTTRLVTVSYTHLVMNFWYTVWTRHGCLLILK